MLFISDYLEKKKDVNAIIYLQIFSLSCQPRYGNDCFLKETRIKYRSLTSAGLGAAAYQLGNTSSHTITEVKQC